MQNILYMPEATREVYNRVKAELEKLVKRQYHLPERDIDIFFLRLERYFNDFYEPFTRLYRERPDFEEGVQAILRLALETYAARSDELKRLDLEREITKDWFERETMVGGIYYVDLFAGTLQGIREKIPYIRELGLNYIHLMPLLKPRPAPNDGGYAVENYQEVNPALGTMEDLEALAADFRASGISLCIDLVVNHTAKEHEWARRAMQGDPVYLDYYLTFDDRTMPDLYEKTLPEVFPDFAPGNFTYYPQMTGKGKWVWTTFNEYQWDLNYTNPAVFQGMLENMLFLANRGVDVLRLDAVPFMWKRMGTICQNEPEVHDILQAFRAAVRIAAPAVIFKAEAIVPPHELIHYLGTGMHTGKECELAYNNILMVMLWSSLASRKVPLMTHTLRQMPVAPPGTTWITYVRCHDDIGWAVTDENAEAVGENGFLHRQFLNTFYSGRFPGSFARGDVFQYNPRTGDGRISGMTASLAGLDKALEDKNPFEIELAVERIGLLYSIAFSYGGIPLIYMGDEFGLPNDLKYREDPLKAADNRWMHRPPMDWKMAEERHSPISIPGRIYHEIRRLIEARKRTPQLHGEGQVEALWTSNEHVFAYVRNHPCGRFLALCNFSEQPQQIDAGIIYQAGLAGQLRDVLQVGKGSPVINNNRISLAPYQAMWLVGD